MTSQEEDPSATLDGELDSYGKKPAENTGDLDGVEDLLVVSTASPNRYPCYPVFSKIRS